MNEDAGAMIDRRLVVKLLVTYLERRNSQEALGLMAKMLHFTDEEKKRVGLDGSRRGLVGALTGGTMALVRGGVSVATLGMYGRSGTDTKPGESLADRWVEFLLKEAEVSTENRRDFRQDPLTLLKDEDPFGTKSPATASATTRMNHEDAGMINDRLPPPRSVVASSPTPSSAFPGAQAPQGQGYTLPSSVPHQSSAQSVPPYPVSPRDFAKYDSSPRANHSDRAPQLPQYQPRPVNGVAQHFPTNGGSPLPSFPMAQIPYSPTVSTSGVKMSSNGGSMPSLRDYMAKYHPAN